MIKIFKIFIKRFKHKTNYYMYKSKILLAMLEQHKMLKIATTTLMQTYNICWILVFLI